MAIRKEPGGITPTGDAENQRVKGISDVAKTVNEMQRNVDKEIMRTESYVEERKDMQEIQSSMNGVLRKLSDTIGALTVGVKNVTSSTAMATKDAISQYGRAVGEDISFKKQNIVAMALARSTPIFGPARCCCCTRTVRPRVPWAAVVSRPSFDVKHSDCSTRASPAS